MRSICVYCGSSAGNDRAYREAAQHLGATLAGRGIGVVYGGARVGLMGTLAEAALAAGGEVTGILPAALQERELAHPGLTRLEIVGSMHERKARMAALADGFIALPGGLGTLEELFEMLTWGQLGFHAKPCGALDVAGYYTPLLRFLDAGVEAGFIRPEYRALLLDAGTPELLLERMQGFRAPPTPRWAGAEAP